MKDDYRYREYLVSLIRGGVARSDKFNILPPTVDQNIEAYLVYEEAYKEAKDSDIMSHKELEDFYNEHHIFLKEIELGIKNTQEEIHKTKEDLFKNRSSKEETKRNRAKLNIGKNILKQLLDKHNSLFLNTCENIAEVKRLSWILEQTTIPNNNNFDILENINDVIECYNDSSLSELQIRSLCKSEPWKSLWSISKNAGIKLFFNAENQDLTINQKNIVTWSQIYDNVQESLECPDQEVIEDDDMLDGWFIHQTNKRKQEKDRQDILSEVGNSVQNHQNVYVIANSQEKANKIHNMNDIQAKSIKARRREQLKKAGNLKFHHYEDIQESIKKDLIHRAKR